MVLVPRSPSSSSATPATRWERCKPALAQAVGAEEAAAWLHPLRLVSLNPGRVVLGGVPNGFFLSRIHRQFSTLLLEAVQTGFPETEFADDVALELLLEDDTPAITMEHAASLQGGGRASTGGASPSETEAADRSAPAGGSATAPLSAGQPLPGATFARFLEAPGNAEALAFAQMVCDQPGQAYNPFVLVGPPGSGKTHLLHAMAHALGNDSETPLVLRTGEAFRHEVLDAIRLRNMAPLQRRYRTAAALVLDDLEVLETTPRSQEELLHVFDALHGSGRQIVLSMSRPPRDLAGLSPALRSRLEMGLQADLAPVDTASARRILQQRCEEESIALPNAALDALASAAQGDLRRLLGLVVRLRARAALRRAPLSAAELEELLAPLQRSAAMTPVILPERVLDVTARYFGISLRALRSANRSSQLVRARGAVIFLLREHTQLSYPEIGALLGGRSHSTILHGHRQAQQRLQQEAAWRQSLRALEEQIKIPG